MSDELIIWPQLNCESIAMARMDLHGAFFSQHIHHMPGFHLIPFDSLEISPGEDGHRHQEQVAEIRGAT